MPVLVVGIVSVPLLVGHSRFVGQLISSTVGVSPVAVAVAGLLVSVVLAATFGLISAFYARQRVDRYQFD